MTEKVIIIRLTDHYFQCGFQKGNAVKFLIEEEPLYIKYFKHDVIYFKKAFSENSSICLMKPKEFIQKKLNEMKEQQKLAYDLPTAETLWCHMMKKIIDTSIDKMKKSSEFENINVCGVILSLPDYLDHTLREMIMMAIEYCQKVFNGTLKIESVSTSIASALFYPNLVVLDSQKNLYDKIENIHTVCYIQHGLYETQWSIVLSKNKNAIVLKTGRIEKGIFEVYKVIMNKIIPKSIDQHNEFDEWPKDERSLLVSNTITNVKSFCEESGIEIGFENPDSNDIIIERENVLKIVEPKMNEIIDEIKKSIESVNEYFQTVKSIEIGSERIDLTIMEKRPKVDEYIVDSNVGNYFLNQCLLKKFSNTVKYLYWNRKNTIIIEGCTCYSHIIIDKLLGKQQVNEIFKVFKNSVVVGLIEKNRFGIYTERNNKSECVITFPKESTTSEKSIEIGYLEKGKYTIKDELNEYQIGSFEIEYKGNYSMELFNYLSPLIPFTKRIDKHGNILINKDSVFIKSSGMKIMNPNSRNHIETERISKRVEITPVSYGYNGLIEEVDKVTNQTLFLIELCEKKKSFISKMNKERIKLNQWKSKMKDIKADCNRIVEMNTIEEMEEAWKETKEKYN